MVFYRHHSFARSSVHGLIRSLEALGVSIFRKKKGEDGLTFVEVAVSVALLGVVFATVLGTLIILNRNASSTRLMTNAREIVQRNIETAVGVPFSTTNVPSILAITSASGSIWDEGVAGNTPVTLYASRDGTMKVTGTLLRIVTAEPNTLSADIRRVTFRLSYVIYGRNLSYELTTIRAKDQ